MKAVTVHWLKRMTFDAEIDGYHVIMDSLGEAGDRGGPTPTGLLLAALAGCTAMDVVSILEKKRQPITGLTIRVEGEQVDEHPHRFDTITVVYEVHGKGIDLAAAERAVELSDQKYCSVAATLRDQTRIATRVEVVEDPGD